MYYVSCCSDGRGWKNARWQELRERMEPRVYREWGTGMGRARTKEAETWCEVEDGQSALKYLELFTDVCSPSIFHIGEKRCPQVSFWVEELWKECDDVHTHVALGGGGHNSPGREGAHGSTACDHLGPPSWLSEVQRALLSHGISSFLPVHLAHFWLQFWFMSLHCSFSF